MKLEDAQTLDPKGIAIFLDQRYGGWTLLGWIWPRGEELPSPTRSYNEGKDWWGHRKPRNFLFAERWAKKAKSLRRIHGWQPQDRPHPLMLLARAAEGKEDSERLARSTTGSTGSP